MPNLRSLPIACMYVSVLRIGWQRIVDRTAKCQVFAYICLIGRALFKEWFCETEILDNSSRALLSDLTWPSVVATRTRVPCSFPCRLSVSPRLHSKKQVRLRWHGSGMPKTAARGFAKSQLVLAILSFCAYAPEVATCRDPTPDVM